jgi:hypothetical protein
MAKGIEGQLDTDSDGYHGRSDNVGLISEDPLSVVANFWAAGVKLAAAKTVTQLGHALKEVVRDWAVDKIVDKTIEKLPELVTVEHVDSSKQADHLTEQPATPLDGGTPSMGVPAPDATAARIGGLGEHGADHGSAPPSFNPTTAEHGGHQGSAPMLFNPTTAEHGGYQGSAPMLFNPTPAEHAGDHGSAPMLFNPTPAEHAGDHGSALMSPSDANVSNADGTEGHATGP